MKISIKNDVRKSEVLFKSEGEGRCSDMMESSRDNEMKVIVGISAIEFLRPPLFVIPFHTTTADKFIQLIISNQETGKNLNTSFQLHC